MTADQFVEKWAGTELSERAASQAHFMDLCRLVGQSDPVEANPTGEEYCFEKSVKVVGSASKGSKGTSQLRRAELGSTRLIRGLKMGRGSLVFDLVDVLSPLRPTKGTAEC